MAEICFQNAPGRDLAQKGRFPMVPEEKFNSRSNGLEMAESCFQAVSLWSQKRNSIAGPGGSGGSLKAPRKLPEGSQKAPRRFPEGSQKAPRSSQKAPKKLPEGSQKVPRGSQKVPRRLPEGAQKAPRRLPECSQKLLEGSQKTPRRLPEGSHKAPRPGFGPKGPFPNGPRREIQ